MSKMEKRIETWLGTNTYHHSEFWSIADLVKAKERAGVSISLCIPTLNEEKTIGKEIIMFKSELMDRYPLLDEIAVVDSGSTDETLAIASSFGADTYLSGEILPDQGFRTGKGENLWKAIYQLKGDIICYVDADIKNIHSKFVSGLVAPLLLRDEIQYVKAFYDRPLALSGGLRPSGGGRVTEILVRPLFSLFFPELTAVMQPLSGEYAVRREVLESLHFPVGYGVETSHLIDLYVKSGLDVFAQVDLDRRVHRNQTTIDLGKMSFGILQTFLKRLEHNGIVRGLPEFDSVFRQLQAEGKRYETRNRVIVEEERPPMITIPGYRERHGR
ncbi:MAG: glucosyl-3-phosphoglycerate synthase [Verrucomicrobiales bacterium]|nr:glucosyl-3-phosphoglycerate synthase [Verrucomicrobiales bacterium]